MDFYKAEFLMASALPAQLPASQKTELVFCGRSNVGKSSLINKLCNRKSLARVSGTPGKTTTINFFSLGEDALLVDLPGYGYAKRSQQEKKRWSALMEHYFNTARNIGLVLLLLDSRHAPSDDDETMLDFLHHRQLPVFVVLTKTDKLSRNQLAEQTRFFEEFLAPYGVQKICPFTVNGQEPAEQLRQCIAEAIVE